MIKRYLAIKRIFVKLINLLVKKKTHFLTSIFCIPNWVQRLSYALKRLSSIPTIRRFSELIILSNSQMSQNIMTTSPWSSCMAFSPFFKKIIYFFFMKIFLTQGKKNNLPFWRISSLMNLGNKIDKTSFILFLSTSSLFLSRYSFLTVFSYLSE